MCFGHSQTLIIVVFQVFVGTVIKVVIGNLMLNYFMSVFKRDGWCCRRTNITSKDNSDNYTVKK